MVALVCVVAASSSGEAGIAVFDDGRILKVVGYETNDAQIALTLADGGTLTVALARIERIVEDEVVDPAAIAALGGWRLGYRPDSKPLFESPFNEAIERAAAKHGMDAALVSAVIKQESNYEVRAVSRKGARGLMQLMPATARSLGVADSFDAEANIEGGVKYLKQLCERYDGDARLMLAAYNAGETAVARYGGIPPYRETVRYVEKIMAMCGADKQPGTLIALIPSS